MKMPGFELTSEPARPSVPFDSILIALPPSANPSLEIIAADEGSMSLFAPLELAEEPEGVKTSADGSIIGGAFVPATQELASDREVVVLEELGFLRGVRLARLVFYPALKSGDSLTLTSHLVVEVKFNQSRNLVSATAPPQSALMSAIKSVVANPGQIQVSNSDKADHLSLPLLQSANSPTAAIEISHDGMIEIGHGDLMKIGFPTNIDPHKLKITRAEQELAVDWLGDGDNAFEAGEKLRFFADPRFSRWSAYDTYYLSVGSTNGLRMGSRSAAPGGASAGTAWVEVLFEENKIYTPDCFCPTIPPGRDDDRWVWERLQRPAPATGTFPFTLPGFDNSQPAELTIWFIGFTDLDPNPDHKVNVSLKVKQSGTTVQTLSLGSVQWDGKDLKSAEFSIPSGLMQGSYELSLSLPGISGVPLEGAWLDAFSVRYARAPSAHAGDSLDFSGQSNPRKYTVGLISEAGDQVLAYDVSQPHKPVILTGMEVLEASKQSPANSIETFSGGDNKSYLPLVFAGFNDTHTSTQYTATIADPLIGGIHHYLLTMESSLPGPDRLRMLAAPLLGTGFAGADYLIISPAEFFSSLTSFVQLRKSAGLNVAVEDVQAVYDNFGDGRPLPEAIKSFLENAYFNWEVPPTYVLLVGDGTFDPKHYRSTSTDTFIPVFLADVDPWSDETAADNYYVTVDGNDSLPDMIIGRLPVNTVNELNTIISKIITYETQSNSSSWTHQALFVADDPDTAGNFPLLSDTLVNSFTTPAFAAQRLYFSPAQWSSTDFTQLLENQWNAGSGMIMFTGHASIFQWAQEIFLHRDNVEDLVNGQKLPVVLEMTCFTSSFQIPDFPTLDEDLVRQSGGGAIATWGSTGLGVATGHHWLAKGFMDTIYSGGGNDIGTAALAGKLKLAASGANPDLIDTFTLLGDPALQFKSAFNQYLPLSQK